MSDATVFSQARQITFVRPVTMTDIERLLNEFLLGVGEKLSYNGIILGHIKVMAKRPTGDEFLFLSLTRLDQVDSKASPAWSQSADAGVDCLELTINVLLFGYSRSTVEKAVDIELQKALSLG
ncbi:MAG: hypothetical protein RIN56_17110 [Sporomusaceae bacterium]|nr:hypothetical protein [Sporomusaceae bacterium]